jgi:hypothetical protein
MDRREFLRKLGKLSLVAGGVALLGWTSGCYTHDDYADVYFDYQDYTDHPDTPNDERYCDSLDYCDQSDT